MRGREKRPRSPGALDRTRWLSRVWRLGRKYFKDETEEVRDRYYGKPASPQRFRWLYGLRLPRRIKPQDVIQASRRLVRIGLRKSADAKEKEIKRRLTDPNEGGYSPN